MVYAPPPDAFGNPQPPLPVVVAVVVAAFTASAVATAAADSGQLMGSAVAVVAGLVVPVLGYAAAVGPIESTL